jgi:hypothetical protein
VVSISNVDLVMAALRSRLRRVAGEKRTGKAGAGSATQATKSTARGNADALEAMRQLPPDEFESALVRTVLEAELGEGISDDPRFARLIEQTRRTLHEDPELRATLRQIQDGR